MYSKNEKNHAPQKNTHELLTYPLLHKSVYYTAED